MKTYFKPVLMITGVALAASISVPAFAQDKADDGMRQGRDGRGPGRRMERMFEEADADKSGTISFEEFSSMGPANFKEADGDGDGNITAEELVDHMMRQRYMRLAESMIKRFDTNEDGQVSAAELEDRQQKMFALADADNSGEIEEDEMRRPHMGFDGDRRDRGHRHGFGGDHGRRHHDGRR